jgi:hypothetical protein
LFELSVGSLVSIVRSAADFGFKWITRPWTQLRTQVTVRPNEHPWYAIELRCVNDDPFVVDVSNIRLLKPDGASLADTAQDWSHPKRPTGVEAQNVSIIWELNPKTDRAGETIRRLVTNLQNLAGRQVQLKLELTCTLRDNRRTSFKVLALSNVFDVAG